MGAIYYTGAVLGDLGVLDLYTRIVERSILWAPGLPEEVTDRYQDYTLNGKYLWGYLEEEKWYRDLVEMSRNASEFDSLPIRVFSGTHLNEKAVRSMGLNPEKMRAERVEMQEEMANLSTNGKVFFLDGGHVTIFTEKKNADIICKEIIQLSEELKN